jgi:hypothetical protein
MSRTRAFDGSRAKATQPYRRALGVCMQAILAEVNGTKAH